MLINLKIILKFMRKGYNRKLHKKTINEKIYDLKLFILCNFKYIFRDFYIFMPYLSNFYLIKIKNKINKINK